MESIIVNIDGGSRGNPGPAACSAVFRAGVGVETIKEYSQYLGVATNNEAEYQGLILALKKTKLLFGKEKLQKLGIIICSDSELLIRQMKGEYKVLGPNIQNLFLQAWNLKIDLRRVSFELVPREQNKKADQLVNEALDSQIKNRPIF